MSRQDSSIEQDYVTSEISYPHEQLEPSDVDDILEKLHIGTLRREQLKQRKSIVDGEQQDDDQTTFDERALDELYKSDVTHSSRSSRSVRRQDSKASVSSSGSHVSGSSTGEFSQQSSINNEHRISRQSSTSEMGIQTTLGRSSQASASEYQHQNGSSELHKKQKRSSKRDKLKKLFHRQSSQTESETLIQYVLPELPQGFLVKYMGKRSTKGLWGSKHTRGPVEEIVDAVGKLPKGDDLPLVNLEVHQNGLAMRPHSKNKIKSYQPVQIPIQFISYGLQDTVYPRIFCFIMVTEMSSQHKSMECHAYVCDSAKNAQRLAASLAVAFESYADQLKDGGFKFTVDLSMRPQEHPKSFCDV